MSIANALLGELQYEEISCRKMLERIPESTWDFKPHEKSMDMKTLATHVAEIWSYSIPALEQPELDFSKAPYDPFKPATSQELLDYFDKNVTAAKELLAKTSDEAMMEPWSMRDGEKIFFTMPRIGVMRSFVISHLIHHRGQLSVYMRENDLPIPSIYGPSADEPMV